jgi:hypothetical protein
MEEHPPTTYPDNILHSPWCPVCLEKRRIEMERWERRDAKKKPKQAVHGKSVHNIVKAIVKRYNALKEGK